LSHVESTIVFKIDFRSINCCGHASMINKVSSFTMNTLSEVPFSNTEDVPADRMS
jgi:hypothetical protein